MNSASLRVLQKQTGIMSKVDKCSICGEAHRIDACDMVQLKPLIPDKPVPPKARLTLPDGLAVDALSDSTYTVRSLRCLEKGTRFGPFKAKKTCSLLPSIEFPLKIFSEDEEDLVECYLDTTDEEECNWMMYIATAGDVEEQNLVCYQEDGELYYAAIRDLYEGDHLKVWYSPYYALLMNKELLSRPALETDDVPVGGATTVNDLVERRNVTSRRAWCCKFCGKAEGRVTDFALHLIHHYQLKLRRVCEVCSGAFSSRKGLQKHMRIVHAKPVVEVQLQHPQPVVKLCHVPDATRNKSDPLLLQTLPDSSCLVLSEQTALGCLDNDSSNLNVDSILVDKGLEHFNFDLNESESEQLVCDVCLKQFQKLKQLVLHLQQHTGRYACLECNKVFTRKENFDHHPCRSFYKLKCPECEKLFLQSKHLHSHLESVHRRRYSCDRCGVRLRGGKAVRERHVCAVDRERTFRCDECPSTFTSKGNLTSHSRAVHGDEASRETFTCPLCLKRLNNRNSYRKHERRHHEKGHACAECGKEFARRDVLREHVAAKHEKSPITCDSCGKTFNTRRLLQRHLLTHSDLKPHECGSCPMTFRTRSNLLRHLRTTHDSVKLNGSNGDKAFACPKCDTRVKARPSLLRHIQRTHPGFDYPKKVQRGKQANKPEQATAAGYCDDLEMELKRTMERIDFSAENDINIEIDKLLNNPVNIDSLLSESNDRLVESLLEIAGSAQALSMPDLNAGN